MGELKDSYGWVARLVFCEGIEGRVLRYMLVETVERPDVGLESWEFCDGKMDFGGEEGTTYGGLVPLGSWCFGRFSGYFAFTLLLSWNTRYSAVGIL
jgi:hypothetical protein